MVITTPPQDAAAPPTARPMRPQWWQRRWLQFTVTAVVALGLGILGSGASAKDHTIAGLRSDLVAAQQQAKSAQDDLGRARSDVADRQADVVAAQAQTQTAQENAQKADTRAQQRAGAQYRTRLDAVAARERAVAARERKVAAAERGLNATAFPGDGTFLVGHDVQPGLYRAAASSGCYWARLRDLTGGIDSIADNNNTDGQVTVQILASDRAIEVARCGDFKKIG